jgi:hypothetical protein
LVSSLTFVALGLAWPFSVFAEACSLFVLFIGCMLFSVFAEACSLFVLFIGCMLLFVL